MSRLTAVAVEKLFGCFDYSISLQTVERMSIIYGPNGYGKTNLLRIIHAFARGDFATLITIPFRTLILAFEDGSQFRVTRLPKARVPSRDKPGPHDCFEIAPFGFPPDSGVQHGIIRGHYFHRPGTRDDLFIPIAYPHFIPEGGKWTDPETGESFTADDLLAGSTTPIRWIEPPGVTRARERFHTVLITTGRLNQSQPRRASANTTVRRLESFPIYSAARELVNLINKCYERYAILTQRTQDDLAMRILSIPDATLSAENASTLCDTIEARLRTIEKRQADLASLGVLAQDSTATVTILDRAHTARLHLLDAFTLDFHNRLSTFDDLVSRTDTLIRIVNRDYFLKTLSVNKTTGYIVHSTLDNERLPLIALSAGEQQLLLLLHQLLFATATDTLVLLDEPEISLNVEWQEQLLNDLIDICNLAHCDIIVASHSPVLLENHWHLATSLSAQAGEFEQLTKGYERILEYGALGEESPEDDDLAQEVEF